MGDTEAPTSEATEIALSNTLATMTSDLDEEQVDFVNLMHQYFGIYGKIMPRKVALEQYKFEEKEYDDLVSNKNVINAMHERGIVGTKAPTSRLPVGKKTDPPPVWADKALTPMQLIVANVIMDLTDTRSLKKKLQDYGLSTQDYEHMLVQVPFQEYLKAKASSLLANNHHEADLALLDKVKSGDMSAIKYFNEYEGRFTQTSGGQSVNVNVGGGTKSDFRAVLVAILEIIQDEVHDADVQLRIGDRFKELMSRQSVAQQLLGESEPIEAPEVMQARKLTPKLEAIVEAGQGYE